MATRSLFIRPSLTLLLTYVGIRFCHHVVQDLIYAAAHDLESQIEINHVSFQLSGAFPTFVCGHLVSSAPPLPSMNIDHKWDALSGGYCISDS